MGGRDDLDLYGRGAAPDRGTGARWFLRVLGVLAGAAVSFFGVALFALRCFDTCPDDPSLDKATQLLSGAVVLFGLVVAVASVGPATRWAAGAASSIVALGVVIAAAGAISLALVPSIGPRVDGGGTALAAGVVLAVGAAVTAAGVFARKSALGRRD